MHKLKLDIYVTAVIPHVATNPVWLEAFVEQLQLK